MRRKLTVVAASAALLCSSAVSARAITHNVTTTTSSTTTTTAPTTTTTEASPCQWEWGGAVEPTPEPCHDHEDPTFVTSVGVALALFALFALLIISWRD